MSRRVLLPIVFLALLLVAWMQTPPDLATNILVMKGRIAAQRKTPPPDAGTFPPTWINGADCGTEPKMQVHAYNEDTYIIRQSKCETYEAPFLFLLFGEDRALLLDTGAQPATPVASIVEGVVADWLALKGRDSIPITVAHTHGHFDHVQGDSQLQAWPAVEELVPVDLGSVVQFWGFDDYPNDQTTIDLGGRKLDVMGVPGHHPVSVAVYDRNTQLLLTGDIVYPGHLFVFSPLDWPYFVESIQRLVTFAANNPVRWVVGCHIEMSKFPGQSFAYTTTVHPDEHVLQFDPSIFVDVLAASLSMSGNPACTIFDEFVIHPVYLCGITWNG